MDKGKSIIETNKLIAKFEGHQINFGFKRDGILFFGEHISIDKLKYHKSWDWLMPVVKKISEFKDIQKYKESEGWLAYYSLETGLFEVDIERVYKTVVEFINWYNENKI